MRYVKIPKRSKGTRIICVPTGREKMRLRHYLSQIARKAAKACPENVCHGFMRGKSAVTNAMAHIGHQYTTIFDLKDFFDSVRLAHLAGKLTKEELSAVLFDGAPRQGLPTSPAVANLAASELDKNIIKWRDKNEYSIVYTRYADDLAFSYDDPALIGIVLKEIPNLIKRCGFVVNPRKTRTLRTSGGRRIICGIGVDMDGIHPTRAIKRKLRAAKHQENKMQAKGLEEWSKLKPPRPRGAFSDGSPNEEFDKLVKFWKLGKYRSIDLPEKPKDQDLGNNCVLTSDPVYMLGMSTFTNGWVTCLTQPIGQYRKSVMFWCLLEGAQLAIQKGTSTKCYGYVERAVMNARALVFTLRDGVRVYSRVYPGNDRSKELQIQLELNGIVSCDDVPKASKGQKVKGSAPASIPIYIDYGTVRSVISKAKRKEDKVRFILI